MHEPQPSHPISNGASTLSLSQVESLPKGDGIHIYFECDPLDEEFFRLKALGFHFDLEPTDQPWLWREARLKDPDENQLIIYSAGNNRLNPPWKVPSD